MAPARKQGRIDGKVFLRGNGINGAVASGHAFLDAVGRHTSVKRLRQARRPAPRGRSRQVCGTLGVAVPR